MTTVSYDDLVANLDAFIRTNKGGYSAYYIGITKDIKARLFGYHKVNKDLNICTCYKANSDKIARDVEQYFLAKGCDGGTGGGDESATFVYCYKISWNTVEREE